MNASIKQRETRIVTRNRTPENIHMAKSSYDWSIEGDEAKRKQDFKSALFSYKKAYESTKPEGVRYLVAKVSSCYRKINRPQAALNFYHEARRQYGDNAIDHAVLTSIAGAYGDLKKWKEALSCANYACELNDGVITSHLDAVYGRISYNTSNYH